MLFLQELKTTEFPASVFTELSYESAAVTQKGYNGVAALSLTPIETISTALAGNGDDTINLPKQVNQAADHLISRFSAQLSYFPTASPNMRR